VNVAVIPARGGSKRIPGKNVRNFAGKPMIAHSIATALDANVFDRVMVSTDDDEIARVALDFGAEVPFVRPAPLADDKTGITEVVAHAVEWLESQAQSPAAVCCISATAPFMRVEDVRIGLSMLLAENWRYVFSATAFSYPIFRAFERTPEGGVEMFFPEHFATRSQDLPAALHDAGQFYWGRPSAWSDVARIFDSRSAPLLIPSWRVQDIDTLEDWKRAEIMMDVLTQMEKHADLL
jgi:pseudaminic acid cytidylyltransferase